MNAKYAICIPTYNAGAVWEEVLESITSQDIPGLKLMIVDSGSSDDTVTLARKYGFEVQQIKSFEFNHGGTRQLLVDSAVDCEICVFLTQDAIVASPNSISSLIKAFDDSTVGIAYGRQLPHRNAKPLEKHLRLFNYPQKSKVTSVADKKTLGFKVFFCSNSFAAYRITALNDVGGFPTGFIMGEDAIVGAKMIKAGHKIAYVADAGAYHSHNYSIQEEYKRYFDTRVFHEQNRWLLEEYGKPTGEGLKFVKSELAYTLSHHPLYLIKSVTSIFAKWLGYKTGAFYNKIPLSVLKKLSMHKNYWK